MKNLFEDQIDINKKILIISFQGVYTDILNHNYSKYDLNVELYEEIPFFEYNNLIRHKDKFSIIFVRDPYQLWYLNNIELIYNYITEKINFLKPTKIITFGVGMGGYASLLFGHLLKVDLVLSYCPQIQPFTTLMVETRILLKEKYIKDINNEYLDLSKIIKFESTKNIIFYGNKDIYINEQVLLLKNNNYDNFIYKEYNTDSYDVYNLNFELYFPKKILMFIISELNLIDENKIIKFNNLNIVHDFIKNKNIINILGKGPTFKKIESKENEIIFCINETINIQEKSDFLVFGDDNTIENLNNNVYNNINFIIILYYNIDNHTNHWLNTHYRLTIFNISQRSNFKGYYIPISEMDLNLNYDDCDEHEIYDSLNFNNWNYKYHDLLDAKIRFLRSTIMCVKFLTEHILGYYYNDLEKKFKLKNKNISKINFYGISKNKPNEYIYNDLFGGADYSNYGGPLLTELDKDLFIKIFNSVNINYEFN